MLNLQILLLLHFRLRHMGLRDLVAFALQQLGKTMDQVQGEISGSDADFRMPASTEESASCGS